MDARLSDEGLDLMFRAARTHRAWLSRPVDDGLLRQVCELAALGPTSGNCQPMRVVLVKSPEAKARLLPCLSPGNVEKTRAAPVTAILAHDLEFHELLPRLFPHADMRANYVGKPELIAATAFAVDDAVSPASSAQRSSALPPSETPTAAIRPRRCARRRCSTQPISSKSPEW